MALRNATVLALHSSINTTSNTYYYNYYCCCFCFARSRTVFGPVVLLSRLAVVASCYQQLWFHIPSIMGCLASLLSNFVRLNIQPANNWKLIAIIISNYINTNIFPCTTYKTRAESVVEASTCYLWLPNPSSSNINLIRSFSFFSSTSVLRLVSDHILTNFINA